MFTSSVYYEDIDKAKTYAIVTDIFSKPLDEGKIKDIVARCSWSSVVWMYNLLNINVFASIKYW